MPSPRVGERVLLAVNLPNQWLAVGESGLVQSIWHWPDKAYEVAFPRTAFHDEAIAVLRGNQIAYPSAPDTDGGFAQERYPAPDSGRK